MPEPEGIKTLDYLPFFLAGKSTAEIITAYSGKPVKFTYLGKEDAYKKYVETGRIKEENFENTWNTGKQSYDVFSRGFYNGNVAPMWKYHEPTPVREMFGLTESLPAGELMAGMRPGKVGYDRYGNKILSDNQIRDKQQEYIDENGKLQPLTTGFWNRLMKGDIVEKEKPLSKDISAIEPIPDRTFLGRGPTTLIESFKKDGTPIWKETNVKNLKSNENVRGIWGAESITNNYLSAIGKEIYNILPGMFTTIGSAMEIGDNIYDAVVYGKDIPSKYEALGKQIQEYGGYMSLGKTPRASTSIFESREAFAAGLGTVAGQLGLMVATMGASQFLGMGVQAARVASVSVFGAYAQGAFNQQAKESGIDPMDIAWMGPLVGIIEGTTELFIGRNLWLVGSHKYLINQMAKKVVKKEISGTLKKFGVEGVEDLSKSGKEILLYRITKGLRNFYKSATDVTTPFGRTLSSAIEEGPVEEGIATVLQNAMEISYDWHKSVTDPAARPGQGMFGEIDQKGSYLQNFLERIPNGIAEASVLGFFGGIMGASGTWRTKMQDMSINDFVATGQGQKLKDIVTDMYNKGQMGYTHTNGEDIITSNMEGETPSINDLAYKDFIQRIDLAEQIKNDYGINKSQVLDAIGKSHELLSEALGTARNIESYKEQIRKLEAKKDKTDEDNNTLITLNKSIEDSRLKLDELIKPEANSKFSKPYNNIVKEQNANITTAKSMLDEAYKKEGKIVDEDFAKTDEYQANLIARLDVLPDNLYQSTVDFQIGYTNKDGKRIPGFYEYKIDETERIKEEKAKRVETATGFEEVIKTITVDPKNVGKSIKNILGKLESIQKMDITYGLDPQLVKKYTDVYKTALKELTGEQEYKEVVSTGKEALDILAGEVTPKTEVTSEQMLKYQEVQKKGMEFEEGVAKIEEAGSIITEGIEKEVEPVKELEESALLQKYYTDDIVKSTIHLKEGMENKFPGRDITEVQVEIDNLINDISKNKTISIVNNKVLNDVFYKDATMKEHLSVTDRPLSDAEYKSINEDLGASYMTLNGLKKEVEVLAANKSSHQQRIRQRLVEFSRQSLTILTDFIPNLEGVVSGIKSELDKIKELGVLPTGVVLSDSDVLELQEHEDILNKIETKIYDNRDKILSEKNIKEIFAETFLKASRIPKTGRFYVKQRDQVSMNYLDDMSVVTDKSTFINSPIGYVYFVNYLERLNGIRANDILHHRKTVLEENQDDDPSTAEQEESQDQILSFLNQSSNHILNMVMKIEKDIYKSVRTGKKEDFNRDYGYKVDKFIPNSIMLRGDADTGKTLHQLRKIFQINYLFNPKKESNIILIGYTSNIRKALSEPLEKVNGIITPNTYSTQEVFANKVDLSSADVIIWDEASSISEPNLFKVFDMLKKAGNPKIIFMGDNYQLQGKEDKFDVTAIQSAGLKTLPLTQKWSTYLPLHEEIIDIYKGRVYGDKGKFVSMPKWLNEDIYNEKGKSTGEKIGTQYYNTTDEVIKAFEISNSKDKALLVLNNEEYGNLSEELRDSSLNENIYILEADLNKKVKKGEPESIQGLRKKEIYVAINIEELPVEYLSNKSTKGRIGYTAATRVSNFLGMVGNVNNQAINKSEVSWRDVDITLEKESLEDRIDYAINNINAIIDETDEVKSPKPQKVKDEGVGLELTIKKGGWYEVIKGTHKGKFIKVTSSLNKKTNNIEGLVYSEFKDIDSAITQKPSKFHINILKKFQEEKRGVADFEIIEGGFKEIRGKGYNVNDVYTRKIDKEEVFYTLENILEKDLGDGTFEYRLTANGHSYPVIQFEKQFTKIELESQEKTEDNKTYFIKSALQWAKKLVYNTPYATIDVTDNKDMSEEDVEKVRAMSAWMMNNTKFFDFNIYYRQDAKMRNKLEVWENFNDVLVVRATLNTIGSKNLLKTLQKAKGNKAFISAKEEIIKKGFTDKKNVKYSYMSALADTEYDYIVDGKRSTITGLDYVKDIEAIKRKINKGFRNEENNDDDNTRTLRELNIALVNLRHEGALSGKIEYKLSDENILIDSKNIVQGTVIYNTNKDPQNSQEFFDKMKSEKGIFITEDTVQRKGKKAYLINRFSRKETSTLTSNNPFIISFMPKLGKIKGGKNIFTSKINKDWKDIVKPLKPTMDINDFNNAVGQTFLYDLIANNQSIIKKNIQIGNFFFQYIEFKGNSVRFNKEGTAAKKHIDKLSEEDRLPRDMGIEIEKMLFQELGNVIIEEWGGNIGILLQENLHQPIPTASGEQNIVKEEFKKELITFATDIHAPYGWISIESIINKVSLKQADEIAKEDKSDENSLFDEMEDTKTQESKNLGKVDESRPLFERNYETRYSSYNILNDIFDRPERIDNLRKFITRQFSQMSFLSRNPNKRDEAISSDIIELYNHMEELFSSKKIKAKGNIKTSRGHIRNLVKGDLAYLTDNELSDYEFYQLSKSEIFRTFVENIYPNLDTEKLTYSKKNRITIGLQKELLDFTERESDIIDNEIEITELNQYDNGVKIKVWDKKSFIAVDDIKKSLMDASNIVDTQMKTDPEFTNDVDTWFTALRNMAGAIEINNAKSDNIYSFLEKFEDLRSISQDNMDSSDATVRKKGIEIDTFLNAMYSNYFSLIRKEYSTLKITGTKDKPRFTYVKQDSSTKSVYKNQILNNVQRANMSAVGSVINENTVKALRGKMKQYDVTEDGLVYIARGQRTSLIKVVDGEILFPTKENRPTHEQIKEVARFLGLYNLSKQTIPSLYDNKSPGVVEQLAVETNIDTEKVNVTEDLLAKGLMNMFWSIESNIDATEKIHKLDNKEDSFDSNVSKIKDNALYIEQIKIFRQELGIKESNIDGQIESFKEEDAEIINDIQLPKPTDFFRFFTAIGIADTYFKGSDSKKTVFDAAGKKRINFGLSSDFYTLFNKGSRWMETKFSILIKENPKEAKVSPYYDDGKILNSLFDPNDGLEVLGIRDILGLKKGDRGTTTPNAKDLNLIAVQTFLSEIKKNPKVEVFPFLMTKRADSDQQIMIEYTFDKFGKEKMLSLSFDKDGNISKATVNDKLINKHINNSFEIVKRDFELSKQRWGIALKESGIFAKGYFKKFGIKEYQTAENLIPYFNAEAKRLSKDVEAEQLINNLIKTDLREVADYNFEDVILSLGNATRFNINEDGYQDSIFNENMYNEWIKTEDKTKFRREELYQEEYRYFATDDGKFYGKIIEYNPVMEAFFYGYEIASRAVNQVAFGLNSNYKDNTDKVKRSKDQLGNGVITNARYGLSKNSKVAFIKDLKIIDDVTGESIEIANGMGWGHPLFKSFFDIAAGGTKFGTYDKTMMKPYYKNNNWLSGQVHQLKKAVDFITTDQYNKSLPLRQMVKDGLDTIDNDIKKNNPDINYDISLYNEFRKFYEKTGELGNRNMEDAMIELRNWIVEESGFTEQIKDNLLYGIFNKSTSKVANSRINIYNPDDIEAKVDLITSDIDNSKIKIVLNPYQDIENVDKLSPATQVLSYIGVGENNIKRGKEVNNLLARIYDIGKAEVDAEIKGMPYPSNLTNEKKIWAAQIEEFFRERTINSLSSVASRMINTELLENRNIPIDMPTTKTNINTSYRNYITKKAIKVATTGLRANQSSGYYFDVYWKDGNPYMIDEIEKELGRELIMTDDISALGYEKRKLRRMRSSETGVERGEVFIANSQMRKFGIRANETLNDIFTVTIKDPITGVYLKKNLRGLSNKDIKHYLSYEIEPETIDNTPLIREGIRIGDRLLDTSILSEEDVESIIRYMEAVEKSLEVFAGRVPANRLGSAGLYKVVGFINDNGNMFYYAPEKNLLDDSDNDIDQVSIMMNAFDSEANLITDQTTVKGVQNEIIHLVEKTYNDIANRENIFITSSVKDITDFAEKSSKDNLHNRSDTYATMLEDNKVDKASANAIGIFALKLSAYSYLAGLGDNIKKIASGFVNIQAHLKDKGKESTHIRLGDYLQIALDDVKLRVLGRLNITEHAIDVVGEMIIERVSNEEIYEFFNKKSIQDIFNQVDVGGSLTVNAKDYQLLKVIDDKLTEIGVPFSQEVKIVKFKGYKSGFENKGKGTPQGDGKDKAMRGIANTSITEVVNRNRESSSYTTEKILPWDSNKTISGIVMLARNKEFAGKNIGDITKKRINEANERNASFVIGDMPNVDSQFIDYLQEIGAEFTIYHTGNISRIKVEEKPIIKVDVKIAQTRIEKINQEVIKRKEQSEKGIKEFTQAEEVILANEKKKLARQVKNFTDLQDIKQLKEYAIKAESLRRFATFTSIRNGIKALDFDFDKFISNSEQYLGMNLKDFGDNKKHTIKNHIEYFKKNNNFYLQEEDALAKTDILNNERLIAKQMDIAAVIRQIPHIEKYLAEYFQQQEMNKELWLTNNKFFGELATNEYLKGQNLVNWDYGNRLSGFNKGVQDYFMDYHFKKQYDDISFNINIPFQDVNEEWNSDESSNFNHVKVTEPSKRYDFVIQFPQFINFLKQTMELSEEEASKRLKAVDVTYDQWHKSIAKNQFLERILLSGRTGQEFLTLTDGISITGHESAKLSKEFKKLPKELQLMFQVNEAISGLRFRKGSILDIMGTDFYHGSRGLKESLEDFKTMIANTEQENVIEMIKNFSEQVAHEKGLTNFTDLEAENLPVTALIKKDFNKMVLPVVNRLENNQYNPEYIEVSTRANNYDVGKNMLTDLEPIHNFTAEELDDISNGIPITKKFLLGHAYIGTDIITIIEEGRTVNKPIKKHYINDRGDILTAQIINDYTVRFHKAGEKIKIDGVRFGKKNISLDLRKFMNKEEQQMDYKSFKTILESIKKVVPAINIIEETNETARNKTGLDNTKGWVDEEGLHYNTDQISYDTPVHELSHIWTEVLKETNIILYNEIYNKAQRMITDKDMLVEVIKEAYPTYYGEQLVSEILATMSGFTSVDVIRDYLAKNNINPTQEKISGIWNTVKEWIDKIKVWFKGLMSSVSFERSELSKIDYSTSTLEDIFKAFTRDVLNNRDVFKVDDIQIQEVFYSVYGKPSIKDINDKYRIDESRVLHNPIPIETTKNFISYLDRTSEDINPESMDNDEFALNIFRMMKKGVELGDNKYRYNFGSLVFSYTKNTSDDKLMEHVKKDIIKAYINSEKNLKDDISMFQQLQSEGKSIEEAGQKAFNGRYSLNVLHSLNEYLNLNDNVVTIKKYSELKNHTNENLRKLYTKEFVGYDPLVIIHNIAKDGTIDLSILDVSTNPLGFRSLFATEGNLLNSIFTTNQYRNKGGTYSNKPFDIRRMMLGMTLMNIVKNTSGNVNFRNIGVLEIASIKKNKGAVKPYMIIDIHELLKNIEILKDQEILTNNIKSDVIRETLNDEILYNSENYKQSFVAQMKIHLKDISELGIDGGYSYAQRKQAENQSNYLFDKNITNADMVRVFEKIQKSLESKGIENLSGKEKLTYNLVNNAIGQLETGRLGSVNKIRDMVPLSKRFTESHNIESEPIQWLIDKANTASSKIVFQYMKVHEILYPLAKSVVKKYLAKSENVGRKLSTIFRDQGSLYFKNIYKEVYLPLNEDIIIGGKEYKKGDMVPVITDRLYHTEKDYKEQKITKAEYEYSKEVLKLYREYTIKSMYDEVVSNNKNLDDLGNPLYTMEEAEKEFDENYIPGSIVMIDKSVSELIMQGDIKRGNKKFWDLMARDVEFFDDALGSSKELDVITNSFKIQRNEDQRLAKIGLKRTEEGYVIVNYELNRSASTNLERTINYVILESLRTSIHGKEVLPRYNSVNAILTGIETIKGVDSMKYNKQFLHDLVDRFVHRKNQDDNAEISTILGKFPVRGLARGLVRALTLVTIPGRPILVARSTVWNEMNETMNTWATSLSNLGIPEEARINLPTEIDRVKAHIEMFKNPKKAIRIAKDFQIVNRNERDMVENMFLSNANKSNLLQEEWGHIGNWTSDAVARIFGMISWMIHEDSYKAYVYNKRTGDWKYNIKEDARYWSKDSNGKYYQTPGQKALVEDINNGLRTRLIAQGIMEETDVEIPRGHDFTLVNNQLKWYGDKIIMGAMDDINKWQMGADWLGNMFGQFRIFSPSKLFNAGLFAAPRKTIAGGGYKAVQLEDGSWVTERELRNIEGSYQSIGKAIRMLTNLRNQSALEWWKLAENDMTRLNLARTVIKLATFAVMVALAEALFDDDDDARKFAWIYNDLNGLLLAHDWFRNPIPITNAVIELLEIALGKRSVEHLKRFAGPAKDYVQIKEFFEE